MTGFGRICLCWDCPESQNSLRLGQKHSVMIRVHTFTIEEFTFFRGQHQFINRKDREEQSMERRQHFPCCSGHHQLFHFTSVKPVPTRRPKVNHQGHQNLFEYYQEERCRKEQLVSRRCACNNLWSFALSPSFSLFSFSVISSRISMWVIHLPERTTWQFWWNRLLKTFFNVRIDFLKKTKKDSIAFCMFDYCFHRGVWLFSVLIFPSAILFSNRQKHGNPLSGFKPFQTRTFHSFYEDSRVSFAIIVIVFNRKTPIYPTTDSWVHPTPLREISFATRLFSFVWIPSSAFLFSSTIFDEL